MAGSKQSSSLPAKKPRAKAAKPASIPKPSLSSKFVVDSDESEDTEIAQKNEPASKNVNSRLKSAKSVAPKASASQEKPSKKRKLPSSSPAEGDSGNSENGDDSNSGDGTSLSKKRMLTVPGGSPTNKPKKATARPVLTKPSIKMSANIKPLSNNKKRGPDTPSDGSNSEAEEYSESSSSGNESGSGKESSSGSSERTSLQSPEKESPVQNSVLEQPEPIYEPPPGFEPTTISFHPASRLSEILAPSNLYRKQIWHITVPESVPISSIKEFSPQSIGSGASILEHHGAKYGLVPQSDVEQPSSRAFLLPSTQTNSYQSSKTNIIKTLYLQQLLNLPSHAPGPAGGSVSALDTYRRTPCQQPEGLRMRYRPFGASDDSDLESISEPIQKAPEFRIPAPVKESSPGKKRKRPESIDRSNDLIATIKPKKHKQSLQATAGAMKNTVDLDAISNKRSNGAESPNKTPHLEINGIKSKGNLPTGIETKEERKKRRKEKRNLEKRGSPSSKPATTLLPTDVKQDAETIQPGEVVEGAGPAIANAVEGTNTITTISRKEGNDKTNKRKDRTGRWKERERANRGASSLVSPPNGEDVSKRDDDNGQDQDGDQIMQEIEHAQRDAEIPIEISNEPPDRESDPGNRAGSVHGGKNEAVDPSGVSQQGGKRTKEEKQKRKEERRKRRIEGLNT